MTHEPVRTEPAYDHFATKWRVPRDEAKRRVLHTLYGTAQKSASLTPQEADDVLEYLHGLNGRSVGPTRFRAG